jgi:hypothetical protein
VSTRVDSTTSVLSVLAPARWRDRAACAAPGVDLTLFFPERGRHDLAARAKWVCAGCPVAPACLADALAAPCSADHGIRGGTTREERRPLRRHAA